MLSTERRRHDVHVLFGDVIYDVRNAHWRVMKTFKFSLVLRTRENTDVFISLDDNIYGIHSKRINILYLFYLLRWNQCISGENKSGINH